MQKPSFWRLLVAYIIDFVITFSIVWGCWHWFAQRIGSYTFTQLDKMFTFNQQCGIYTLLVLVPNVLYFAGCECLWKKTIGKWVLGIKVFGENQRSFVGRVLVAYGIDFLLLVSLVPVLMLCVSVHMALHTGLGLFCCGMSRFDWFVVGGTLSVMPLYFPICELYWSKTLGKKLMGLQVVQNVPQKQEKKGEK